MVTKHPNILVKYDLPKSYAAGTGPYSFDFKKNIVAITGIKRGGLEVVLY